MCYKTEGEGRVASSVKKQGRQMVWGTNTSTWQPVSCIFCVNLGMSGGSFSILVDDIQAWLLL